MLCIRLFKYLVYLNVWILNFFFFFCCCDLYYCNKNFIYIYKIVLEVGRGGSPWGPKGRGWGKVVCPAPRGGAGMGKGNNHAGRGRRSHPPAPPRPIAIPDWNPQQHINMNANPLYHFLCTTLCSINHHLPCV